MSDQRERKSRAARHVRLNAQRAVGGLGNSPTSTSEIRKGYSDDLLAGFIGNIKSQAEKVVKIATIEL